MDACLIFFCYSYFSFGVCQPLLGLSTFLRSLLFFLRGIWFISISRASDNDVVVRNECYCVQTRENNELLFHRRYKHKNKTFTGPFQNQFT